jgi:hypothetical protein
MVSNSYNNSYYNSSQTPLPLQYHFPITLLLAPFLQNWPLDPFAQPYQTNLTETVLEGDLHLVVSDLHSPVLGTLL